METLGTYVANVVLIIVMLKTCINTSMPIKWNILFICRSLHGNRHIVLKNLMIFFNKNYIRKKNPMSLEKFTFEKKICTVK